VGGVVVVGGLGGWGVGWGGGGVGLGVGCVCWLGGGVGGGVGWGGGVVGGWFVVGCVGGCVVGFLVGFLGFIGCVVWGYCLCGFFCLGFWFRCIWLCFCFLVCWWVGVVVFGVLLGGFSMCFFVGLGCGVVFVWVVLLVC